ncbi:MAG: alpha/beta fold hydrolase [Kiritimatiellae bacterium]|nr:alpha/beta fold hydrolase [Kiritimatiellia bacterium]
MTDKSSTPHRRWLYYGLVLPVRIAALVFAGAVLMFLALQRKYIYFPVRAPEAELSALAGRAGLADWRDAAGDLLGWRTRRSLLAAPKYRLAVFHGNAGFALHRQYFVDGFHAAGDGLQWEVLLFEYPGYGARPGRPSEKSIKSAAEAAVKSLLAEDDRPLFLAGESLGSGVAAWLAGRFPDRVAGLFLVTPMTRLADVAAHHYPFLPVRRLLREQYDAAGDLKRYAGPVAVLLAGRDEVVPAAIGRRLFDGYAGPKRLWVQEEAGHNTLDYDPRAEWWHEVAGFLTEKRKNPPPAPPEEGRKE